MQTMEEVDRIATEAAVAAADRHHGRDATCGECWWYVSSPGACRDGCGLCTVSAQIVPRRVEDACAADEACALFEEA